MDSIAEQIAKEFNLDKDAILDKNENIFYFINNDSIIEVDRKTHLSRCLHNGNRKVTKLVEAVQILKDYLG